MDDRKLFFKEIVAKRFLQKIRTVIYNNLIGNHLLVA